MMPPLEFLEEVAREAGEILMRHHGRLSRVHKKGARDLVTEADREAERHILARICDRFPGDGIIAEESLPESRRAHRLWIIDPLDGTTNFVYRIPHFAVSIAFYLEGRPLLGCVFNQRLDECFTAARGGGAHKNGGRISCNGTTRLSEALLATGFAYRREEKADSNLQHFVDMVLLARGLRRLGSAALDLCYVAEGVLDGFWELHLSAWDVAAGALIAAEAGALVTDFDGEGEWLFGGRIVAAPAELSAEIRRVLLAADPRDLPGPLYRPQRRLLEE